MVIRNKLLCGCAFLSSLLWTAVAGAYELQMNTAKMQAMDKITGKVSVIEVPVNGEVKFGSFSIVVRACKATPPEETPENYAFVDVADTAKDGKLYNIFKGWMMSSSPALNAVEHPIYDVWLLQCLNQTVSNDKLLSAEELSNREGLPRKEDIQTASPSKEAILAAEAEAEAKIKQAEEKQESGVVPPNTGDISSPSSLSAPAAVEELPIVPEITETSRIEVIAPAAEAVENETAPGELQKQEDNAPVSLLPTTNESPTVDGPQPLINIPEPVAPTEVPVKSDNNLQTDVSVEKTSDIAPVILERETITETVTAVPQEVDSSETSTDEVNDKITTPESIVSTETPALNSIKAEDILPLVEAPDEEAVEEDQFIDSETDTSLETILNSNQQ